jgi:uncharacterized protein (TIGR02246 family)
LTDQETRKAIEGLLHAVVDAWAAHDADQLAQAFAEDAIFIPFHGARLKGREEIAAFHSRPFATELRGSRLQVDLVDIRPLADNLYLVATQGGPLVLGSKHRVEETQSYICRNLGNRWAIEFFQNTPVLAEP